MAKYLCFMIITRVKVRDNKDVFLDAPHVFLVSVCQNKSLKELNQPF